MTNINSTPLHTLLILLLPSARPMILGTQDFGNGKSTRHFMCTGCKTAIKLKNLRLKRARDALSATQLLHFAKQ